MNDTNDNLPPRKDAAQLLEEFLSSGERDAAFTALVQGYGGLVYSSALRRTNDPQISEEVVQNVFAIIAHKANALRQHPALMAWIFKTTRFEASKAMRAERRRQKKHAKLALESTDEPGAEDDQSWREAVPLLDESLDDLSEKDRQIVLQRFFEERKFKEIAQESGRSEAACKMQLKRALTKLSKLLSKRGVALSATVIASGLGSELASAAPAKALATIAPKALAASSQIGAASTITHLSIQAMSTIKTATITGAAVVAVATAPFLWQQSTTKKLNDDFADLEKQRIGLAQLVEKRNLASADPGFAAAVPARRTVQDLLRISDEPIDADTLIKSVMDVMMSQDIVGMLRVLLPVTSLTLGEYDALIVAIQEHEAPAQAKGRVMEMLGSFAPSDNPQQALERVMKFGIEPHSYSDLLSNWGSQDPQAALAWYRQHEAEGAFVGKGVNDHYDGYLLAELIGGIGKKDPQLAFELFEENREGDKWNRISKNLAASFGKLIRKGGDDAMLRELLAAVDNSSERTNIVTVTARVAVSGQDVDEQMEFAKRYVNDPRDRMFVAIDFASASSSRPLAERGDWLLQNTPADLQAEAIGKMIEGEPSTDMAAVSTWVGQQDGEIRDSGLQSISTQHTMTGKHLEALEHVEQISSEELRSEAMDQLARRWVGRDIRGATEALPAELIEKYQPAHAEAAPSN